MSGFAEYEQYDALGLAELIRRNEVSPDELLDAAIARVEALHPELAPEPVKFEAGQLRGASIFIMRAIGTPRDARA
jgi:Asp-tRNA(Asn)/Glu-tRNA(Gln) amidotransferase A subunit family amidase